MTEDANATDVGHADSDAPIDHAVGALTDPLVHRAVSYLRAEERATLDRLADVITGWESAAGETVATPDDREQIRVALYHVHLPTLDALGVVDFDSDAREVEFRDPPESVRSFLDHLDRRRSSPAEDESS